MLQKVKEVFKQFINFRSLRVRLFFIILVVGIVPSAVMRHSILHSYEQRAVQQRTQVVQNQLRVLADHLVNDDYLNRPYSTVVNAELEMLSKVHRATN